MCSRGWASGRSGPHDLKISRNHGPLRPEGFQRLPTGLRQTGPIRLVVQEPRH